MANQSNVNQISELREVAKHRGWHVVEITSTPASVAKGRVVAPK